MVRKKTTHRTPKTDERHRHGLILDDLEDLDRLVRPGLELHLPKYARGRLVDGFFGAGACVPLVDVLAATLFIHDRHGRLTGLRPNEAQKLYARWRTQRNIILKARQVGMTTYIAARFFVETLIRRGTVTLQVAHTLESAQRMFAIVHRFVRHLDPRIHEMFGPIRVNQRELTFEMRDCCYLLDTAGNRNAGRGLTLRNLHASRRPSGRPRAAPMRGRSWPDCWPRWLPAARWRSSPRRAAWADIFMKSGCARSSRNSKRETRNSAQQDQVRHSRHISFRGGLSPNTGWRCCPARPWSRFTTMKRA